METGWLVWIALKPIIKLFIIMSIGYYLAYIDLIPPIASKTISKLLLLVLYPALIFSAILKAVNAQTLNSIAILMVFSVLYLAIGHTLGYCVKKVTNPPETFKNSTIMACSMGNWGDLPMAIVLNVGASAPFTAGDTDLGVAYIAGFCLLVNIYFFSIGLGSIGKDMHALIEMEKSSGIRLQNAPDNTTFVPVPVAPDQNQESNNNIGLIESSTNILDEADAFGRPLQSQSTIRKFNWSNPSSWVHDFQIFIKTPEGKMWIQSLTNNNIISILLGIFIACIPQLRGLFINSNSKGSIEQQPPLAFLFEICVFLGSAAIPLGLLNLGAALATLSLSKFLPWKILAGISIARLIIMPIFGFTLVWICVHLEFISSSQKMLIFVLMFQACVPTANSTVFFTQYWHPRGEAIEISSVIITQYLCCILTLTLSLVTIISLLL